VNPPHTQFSDFGGVLPGVLSPRKIRRPPGALGGYAICRIIGYGEVAKHVDFHLKAHKFPLRVNLVGLMFEC
jgi:hypothetical protein